MKFSKNNTELFLYLTDFVELDCRCNVPDSTIGKITNYIEQTYGLVKLQDKSDPVIGQEAVCPDGLGRVIAFENDFPKKWIQVSTYFNDRSCKWHWDNIKLVPIPIE